ncbi:MAG: SIMPL domain-containing protein [Candidatus Omnitrophica bacterium CG11_big_fil_rev_8_21_14_0_20_42_13]|uniref:SIMPL domain-containing protein n=1 Tax=Candidatus Ghiorseimicrobium undicola TaxID=1974746 RepID=A0A2H0LUZ1_9BACT|nr:MAG: SIMPL domain-containing protein [Candidatus Omnitrophica bacterium CG11_big_fil_rev_8_21_14_0_20_42_13]
MEGGLKVLKNTQIIILGICFAVATIVSTVILSKGLLQIKKFSNEVIDVTGSAEKKIVSDYIVWESAFTVRNPVLKTAYAELREDLGKVKAYFLGQGIKEDELIVNQATTQTLYEKTEEGHDTNEVVGYKVAQSIEVRSFDVKKVMDISRKSTELLDQDVQFISGVPEYFYTKLAELKVEMLAMATENAKERAKSMAASTGNKIGLMRSAKMGIFQITPVNSYDVSWYGNNDTSSYEKKVMAVVNVTFAIGG